MSKYDIIIAGSGLGGLECATILSKEGYNVCVLEKNELFGGCFQTYVRKGYLLDTGIHYVGSLEEGKIMNQYFRYFGIMDRLNLVRMDEEAFDRIIYKGRSYDFAMGHSCFVDQMSGYFPGERENLQRYSCMLQEVGKLTCIETLKKGFIAADGMRFFCASASGLIADMIADKNLQAVLAGTSMLYGGQKDVSTFYHHAVICNSFIEGAYRFVDGSMQVPEQLIRVIKENGGTVLNRKEVTRFIVDGTRVKGVEVNHEEILEADYFISDIHPGRTLELLDKGGSVKGTYVARIRSRPNTYGLFTLYLFLKKNSYPYHNRNYYLHGTDDVWYDATASRGKINHCLISEQASSENPSFTEVMTILAPMYMEELHLWEHTVPGLRGEDYVLFKEAKSQQIIGFLKQHGIEFGDSIHSMSSTTPLSYRDFTGSVDGSAYGIVKDYKCPQKGFVSARTKMENLFLTGQNLNVHGALGVTLTSMMTCSELLGEEYLAKKAGNA